MKLYQDGNEDAFRLLYQRTSSKIYGYLVNKVKDTEIANEIFQSTFLKLHRGRHLYNQNLPFLPWLFAICRNALSDYFRKNKANQEVSNELALANAMASPDYENFDFPKLPKTQQLAIELRYLEGFSFEEISKKLNTTSLNVRQLISRGTRKIKAHLSKGEK